MNVLLFKHFYLYCIMTFLINYLFYGLIFMFFIELLVFTLGKTHWEVRASWDNLTNFDKVVCLLIWPVGLVVLIIAFIKKLME